MNAFVRFAKGAMIVVVCGFLSHGLAQEKAKKESPSETKKDAPSDGKKVYRNVTADKLEAILKGMKIDAKKVKGKAEGIWFYDFEKNDYKIRLHNYQGNDLWIDAHFNEKLPLE